MDHIQKHRAEQAARIYGSYNQTTQQASEEELEKSATDYFQKGKAKHAIGEIKAFGGRNYIKTADGWKYHGKGKSAKAQDHTKGALQHHVDANTDHAARAAKLSDDELDDHYGAERPKTMHDKRSPYFAALHKELLKREQDPKSKFHIGKHIDEVGSGEIKKQGKKESIGKTSSGKEVFNTHDASHEDYKDFSARDHADAAHLHAQRSGEDSRSMKISDSHTEMYKKKKEDSLTPEQKAVKEIHDKIDVEGLKSALKGMQALPQDIRQVKASTSKFGSFIELPSLTASDEAKVKDYLAKKGYSAQLHGTQTVSGGTKTYKLTPKK